MSEPASPRRPLHLGVTPWTPADDEDPASSLIAQARLAESLGFDSFFVPESHLHRGARPAPLVTLAAIAGATERIRLGTTSLLLPLRDPLLLAEEVATLDRLSGGRLVLGLGRGFRQGTFEAFGVDAGSKRHRFEQVLATMLRAWGVEPGWMEAPAPPPSGVPRIEPRPLQRPHPPLWVAAFGPKAIDQAARLGLPYLVSPLEPHQHVERNFERHRELARAAQPSAAVPLPTPAMRTVLVSPLERERERIASALNAERAALARSRGLTGLAGDPLEDWAIVADPADAIARLRALVGRLGLTHLIVRTPAEAGAAATEASLRALSELRGEISGGP